MEESRDGLIAAVRAVAGRTGSRQLRLVDFRACSGCDERLIYRHFSGWPELCRAAGLEPHRRGVRTPDADVFAAVRDGFIAAGGIVARSRMPGRLPSGAQVPEWRWGGWNGLLVAFRDWAGKNAPDFPYLAELDARIARSPKPRKRKSDPEDPAWPVRSGRAVGDPLGFRALLHAPVNEQGVVLLFGMVAGELGFAIDTVQPGFPDCDAKRRVGPARWESVRIEFEFRSRAFREHRHDVAGCDLIVCWEHDWPDCPIEVLELRAAIAELPAAA